MLRETLATELGLRRARRAGVACSYPNAGTTGGTGSAPGGLFHCGWGPIGSARTTYARFKDFGNYVPATLVVEKQLEPSSDPGRFDLLVNQTVVIAGAGDGAVRGSRVRPGAYTVSESGGGDEPGQLSIDRRVQSRNEANAGPIGRRLREPQLLSGQLAVCTFRNVRLGSPAIAIDKVGPASATAGDTLRYQLFVSNPGDLPFPAASVRVVDPNCDPQPPALVGKADAAGADDTPRTLDPGDIWTYSCSKKTVAPEDCRPSVVTNTAVVTGEADGSTVRDDSRVDTALTCPPRASRASRATSPSRSRSAAARASVARCATGAGAAGRRRCSGRRCGLPSDHLPVHSRPGSANQPRGHTDLTRPRARERPTGEGADRADAAAAADSTRDAPAREVQPSHAGDLPARDGESGRPPPGHDSDLRGARRQTAVHGLATGIRASG